LAAGYCQLLLLVYSFGNQVTVFNQTMHAGPILLGIHAVYLVMMFG
jgi:hypothetical protein